MSNNSISQVIRQRLLDNSIPFASNDNISMAVSPSELLLLQDELAVKMQAVLDTLVIDTQNDHNSKETANRVAKMMLQETFSGRYRPLPSVTDFPNAKNLDELYTVGPIHVDSSCSHHMVPIQGKLWVGIHPGERVIGLSKFHRLAAWNFRRPQIQEESTIMFADLLEELIQPQGLAVVFKAQHLCCSWRGVRDHGTWMNTSVVRGTIRENQLLKDEFFTLIKDQ
jgi:GTP cyclohydrolase I